MSLSRDHSGSDAPTAQLTGPPVASSVPLETVEPDMSTNLPYLTTEEDAAAVVDDRMCKVNEVERTTKRQDAAYKVKVSKQLDMTLFLVSALTISSWVELDALLKYPSKIEGQAVPRQRHEPA